MKKAINILLVIAVVVPFVLLFWPFIIWKGAMSLILRIIPSLAIQLLLYRVGKYAIIKAIPLLLTGALAVWGTYLYHTSPHWSSATLWGLIADYVSPFVCCTVMLIICTLIKKKHLNEVSKCIP